MAEAPHDAGHWLPAARAGSREALGQALEACRGFLLAIAQRQLDPELQAKGGASDLVQQTFLEAQRDFAHFQGDSDAELLAWLRHLLLHNLGKFRRRYRTRKRRAAREVALDAGDSSDHPTRGIDTTAPSASGQAQAHEQVQALEQALGRLPEEYRQVITLRHKEYLSFQEIGCRMERSANAARTLWMRAIDRLRQELRDHHER
jgi:RNA polymerase sigma-70 factor (ECF subfamily)